MAPLSSATTPSAGSPTRPGSAVTTPRTWIVVPIAEPRAVAMVTGSPPGDGDGAGEGLGSGVGVGDGLALGSGEGEALGSSVGDGVGDGAGPWTTSSGFTTNNRYPPEPVPDESRCPSGPATETRLPRAGTSPAASPAKTMRSAPDPSSSVTAGPSERIVGASITVP
jgi:hypothetical protein